MKALAKNGVALQNSEILDRGQNNFGFLRLLFATLVILSHSPELVDGNRSREILTGIFGTISFGDLAVDGFFLLSGYLITSSYINTRTRSEYLLKRFFRIYPGYVVAFVVSIIIGGALAGGNISSMLGFGAIVQLFNMVLLDVPHLEGSFRGLHYSLLNGSMWTIAYEFRCYLLVMLLGTVGILNRRWNYLALTSILVVCMIINLDVNLPHAITLVTGEVKYNVRFFSIFCVGGTFYLFRDKILYSAKYIYSAVFILVPLLFIEWAAELALVIFGGYLLFWFAFHAKANVLSRFDNKIDLSYGLYLYAWPIQQLIIWQYRDISPWMLFVLSAITAAMLAYFSWTLVERPFVQYSGYLRRQCTGS